MPEIKNHFTGGKMNKDLDERLVPKGEYRDAMNIQVSTSEESGVGTVQNILGNQVACRYQTPGNQADVNPIPKGSTTVGTISDEINNHLYWFVGTTFEDSNVGANVLNPGETRSFKDLIMRTDPKTTSGCRPVFVDHWKFCTGLNVSSSPVVTNSIVLNNTSLYSSIKAGMTVYGYDNYGTRVPSISFTAIVDKVGTLELPPLN